MTSLSPTAQRVTVLELTPSRWPDRTLRYTPAQPPDPVLTGEGTTLRLVPVDTTPGRVAQLGWIVVEPDGRESIDCANPAHAVAADISTW